MIVDDEPDFVSMLRERLSVDYHVLTASDGRTGLDKARQERPDLILLDLMMPRMNGYEVCDELKRDVLTKGIVVIILTAKVEEAEKYRGLKSGADDYITKPFKMTFLLERIKEYLERKSPHKILIVDDDRDLVRILTDRLEFEGYETVSVYEGLRAIEIAHHKMPDLILLDLQMPAGNGQTVLQNLRSRPLTKNIPVIVLTGVEGERLEEEMRVAGAQGLMRKPYDMEMLLRKIRSFLPRL